MIYIVIITKEELTLTLSKRYCLTPLRRTKFQLIKSVMTLKGKRTDLKKGSRRENYDLKMEVSTSQNLTKGAKIKITIPISGIVDLNILRETKIL